MPKLAHKSAGGRCGYSGRWGVCQTAPEDCFRALLSCQHPWTMHHTGSRLGIPCTRAVNVPRVLMDTSRARDVASNSKPWTQRAQREGQSWRGCCTKRKDQGRCCQFPALKSAVGRAGAANFQHSNRQLVPGHVRQASSNKVRYLPVAPIVPAFGPSSRAPASTQLSR